MPIYDYVCSSCGLTIEVMHAAHGHGPATCTKCGGHMKRVFSPLAVHYRGTGWARKERSSGARQNKSAPADKASASDEGAASSSSGTTEAAKPASPAKDQD